MDKLMQKLPVGALALLATFAVGKAFADDYAPPPVVPVSVEAPVAEAVRERAFNLESRE